MRNLVLIGFMASGKSTVGRDCARALGYRFRDSDTLVERRAGKPITRIFAEDGEAAFRKQEASAIRTLAGISPIVLATGGGAVLDPGNVSNLKRNGVVVLLWAPAEALLARTGPRLSRPLLAGAQDPRARIESLLKEREPAYRAAADAVVDTSILTRPEAVEKVLATYRRLARPPRAPACGEIGSSRESGEVGVGTETSGCCVEGVGS